MKTMTKLFALGALGAGAYAIARAKQAKPQRASGMDFDVSDLSDLDAPVVVTDEVVVISEVQPYEVEMIGNDQRVDDTIGTSEQRGSRGDVGVGSLDEQIPFDMPGRGAGPR